MAKITINPLSGSYASVTAINARLQQIEDALNDDVLWRTIVEGEDNNMAGDLDLSGYNLLNAAAFSADGMYLGAFSSAPTTAGDGTALDATDAGVLYFNTVSTDMWVWSGYSWGLIGTAQNSASSVTISDAGGYYTGSSVEEALAELFNGTSNNATKTGTETLSNKTVASPVITGTISGNAFLDEDDMASNSAVKVASQQSIKKYVDDRGIQLGTGAALTGAANTIVSGLTGAKRITIHLVGYTPNAGTSELRLNLGTLAGGIYSGAGHHYTQQKVDGAAYGVRGGNTTYMELAYQPNAAADIDGTITLTRTNTNNWHVTWSLGDYTNAELFTGTGYLTLSDVDRIQLTDSVGAPASGNVSVNYEI